MKVIYYTDSLPEVINKSIFLAGPTVRQNQDIVSWRKEALQVLQDLNYDGTVFVPEFQNNDNLDFSQIVEWEDEKLNMADAIVFWIPRDKDLPGFTTNIEFGRWENSGKVFLGYPDSAKKMKYIQYYADKYSIPKFDSLKETLQAAISYLGKGASRRNGDRFIPLHICRIPSFQSWYKAQKAVGNRIDGAKVLYTFQTNPKFTFLWILKVDIFIAAENRNKTNEFVLSRPDIASIVMWKRNEPLSESEIVLIKEFRSSANNSDCFIRELPGGSSSKSKTMSQVILDEVVEETGFTIDPSRLKSYISRQTGTLSAHKVHVFSVYLTQQEIDYFKSQKNIPYGIIEDSERTFVEVVKLDDILYGDLEVDWCTLGQIMYVTDKLE